MTPVKPPTGGGGGFFMGNSFVRSLSKILTLVRWKREPDSSLALSLELFFFRFSSSDSLPSDSLNSHEYPVEHELNFSAVSTEFTSLSTFGRVIPGILPCFVESSLKVINCCQLKIKKQCN